MSSGDVDLTKYANHKVEITSSSDEGRLERLSVASSQLELGFVGGGDQRTEAAGQGR